MRQVTTNRRILAAWAGILGPAIFVTVFLVEGWLRPGYNPLNTYVSALSLGPRGWVQITSFLLTGPLLFVFALGVASHLRGGPASRGGVILLAVIGVCFFLSGPFVMDSQGTPVDQATTHGTIHGILGAIAFLLMPISMFVFLRRFRIDPNWSELRGWTLGLGTVCAAALVVFSIVSKGPSFYSTFSGWFGLLQRAVILPFMIWVFLFGLALLRKTSSQA